MNTIGDGAASEQFQTFMSGFESVKRVLLIGPCEISTFLFEIKSEVPTIYVDGGANWRTKIADDARLSGGRGDPNQFPGRALLVGDGDSHEGPMDVVLPQAKDYSDFAFALKNLPWETQEVETHGFLGGESSHEILNFGEAHHFLKKRENTYVNFNGIIWAFSPGEWSFYLNGRFSLVNFEKCAVTLEGLCEYQIKTKTILEPVTSFGLSNEANGKVTVTSTAPSFIFAEKTLRLG